MTRIDFYLLQSDDSRQRELFACRLVEKAFNQGLKVYLHAGSETQARELDALLWTFRDRSFLPHALGMPADDDPSAIVVGNGQPPEGWHDVLVNLADEVPESFSRFERILEILNGDEQVRRPGRDRFKFYRDRGYTLETHDMKA